MKKDITMILSIFLLISFDSFAQEIRVDEAITTDCHSWSLESIELNDDCTLFKWKVTSLVSETEVSMTKGVYLEDALTGNKYYSNGIEGIPYEPESKFIMPQYGSVDFIVKFPPLAAEVKEVHYMSSTMFQVRNLKLTRKNFDLDRALNDFNKASKLLDDKEYEKANAIFLDLAEDGFLLAQYNLARIYFEGLGVKRNMVEAAKWAKESAKSGLPEGYLMYANLCFEGIGIKRNLVESAKWMLKAAEAGNATAQCYMGMNYDSGMGVQQDYLEAAKWYKKSADQGMPDAANNLAHLYAAGKGVKSDYQEAGKWFLLAAQKGSTKAQYTIGLWYLDGFGGWQKNEVEGMKWLIRAAENGEIKAKIKLSELGK